MDKAEILRYMRTSSGVKDEGVLALADRAAEMIEQNAAPKTLYRIFDCTVGENSVTIGGKVFASTRLSQHLKGCKRAVIFGATLGTQCDRLINAAATTDVALAMALQAAGACKIEEVCDELEQRIIAEHGVKLRSRYSPGYYDLDISQQSDVFELVELTKRIGVTLTDTYEMLPTKSVTAIIGIEND
ncbi:MAG: Vitamin B12 dependent methionine synthase activation subunit [Ruminococcaceae bacterium]|nr:Vitamin B12 dependent methionine synthase activation subunit [Oscillospiraceae bacterium]